MSRKLLPVLAVLCAIGLVLTSCSSGKSYSADRYDIAAAVQPDGSLQVQETATFRFQGGPFTYVFRELPTGKTGGIVDVQATLDGERLPGGTGPGQVEVASAGDTVRVRWHFAPLRDAVHTFGLSYRALDVVRQEPGADLLAWGALPVKHAYPIRASTVTVTWPVEAQPLAPPRLLAGQGTVQQGPRGATISAQDIGEDRQLTFEQRFAPGSILSQPPEWQARQQAANRAAPPYVALSLLILMLGSVWYVAAARRNRLPRGPYGLEALVPCPPPAGRPAAVAGVLAGGGRVTWPQALGTLFDLGQRGVLDIEQTGQSRWTDRAKNYACRLLQPGARLAPHEQGLLDLIFGAEAHGAGSCVTLADVRKRRARRWKAFKEPLLEELRLAGLVDPAREAGRNRLLVGALVLMGLSTVAFVVLTLAALGQGFWPPLLLPAAAFLVSIVGFVTTSVYSVLTAGAAEDAAQWRRFQAYLRQVARGRAELARPGLYETYLPLAASLGQAEPWAKAMARQSSQTIPGWFHTLAGAGDTAGAFVAMVAAHSAAGGSGAGGAAGGAAGGGASGAG